MREGTQEKPRTGDASILQASWKIRGVGVGLNAVVCTTSEPPSVERVGIRFIVDMEAVEGPPG